MIEAFGSTKLVQVGSNFVLDGTDGSPGPTLRYGGAPAAAGGFGEWKPIAAERTANGYLVAWKLAGIDGYTVWATDGAGNYISNIVGGVSGTSATLQSFELQFQQDLNDDGAVGAPPPVTSPTVIEAFGSTKLVQVGSNFVLDGTDGSPGPTLRYGGAPAAAGGFGEWKPIAAERTANGYLVAWKLAGIDGYTVWATDGAGNYISNIVGGVSGTSATLQSFELQFQQDLNDDGAVGAPPPVTPPPVTSPPVTSPTVIEASGSTKLVQVGSNFVLDGTDGSPGPTLRYGGAPAAAGGFGAWTPIAAERTAGGYLVAWKLAGIDGYTVWATDSAGNYISNIVGGVSGTSATLQSFELQFQQDLNDDGAVGAPTSAKSGRPLEPKFDHEEFDHDVGGDEVEDSSIIVETAGSTSLGDRPSVAKSEQGATAGLTAIAIEPSDPAQLISLIQSSRIQMPVRTITAKMIERSETFVFDETTGDLLMTIDETPQNAQQPVLIDNVGEEWVLWPSDNGHASLARSPSPRVWTGR